MKKKSREEIFKEAIDLITLARYNANEIVSKLGEYGIEAEIKEELKKIPSELNWVLELLYDYKNSKGD